MNFQLCKDDKSTVLRIFGALDSPAAAEIDPLLDGIVSLCKGDLVLDLSEMSYLNSSGIKLFLRLEKKLQMMRRGLSLRGAAPNVLRIFHSCGLDTYFTFADGRWPGRASDRIVSG